MFYLLSKSGGPAPTSRDEQCRRQSRGWEKDPSGLVGQGGWGPALQVDRTTSPAVKV